IARRHRAAVRSVAAALLRQRPGGQGEEADGREDPEDDEGPLAHSLSPAPVGGDGAEILAAAAGRAARVRPWGSRGPALYLVESGSTTSRLEVAMRSQLHPAPTERLPEPTRAEREVADLLQIGASAEAARAALDRVPLWFHTFSLDEGSVYTPGVAR